MGVGARVVDALGRPEASLVHTFFFVVGVVVVIASTAACGAAFTLWMINRTIERGGR